MSKYLFLSLLSFFLAFLLTPLVRRAALWVGAIDQPGERKVHRQPIARLRGVAIAASFFLTLLAATVADRLFGPLTYFDPSPWQGLFPGAGVVVVLGAWDDVRPLRASTKFLIQLGAAGLALGFGFHIHAFPLLGHPIYSQLLSVPLMLLWILLITNAFNLIDGLDGLSGGLAFIAGLTLLAISLVRGDVQTALLTTVLCGAIVGFLRYNFHPASLFLGDSGSLFLGYVLSLVTLRSSIKGITAVAILAPLLATVALSSSPPASVMVIDFLLFSCLTTVARTSFRLLEYVKFKGEERDRRALIYGAGRGGGLTLRECLQNRRLGLRPVGFVDDDPGKLRRSLNGCPVLSTGEDIPALVDAYHIDTILISSPDIPPERVTWLQEVSETRGVELKRCMIVLETITGNGEVGSGGGAELAVKSAGG